MCKEEGFVIGQRTEASEEAKRLSQSFTERYNELWQLILRTNHQIIEEQKEFFKQLRHNHPELDNYGFRWDYEKEFFTILVKE